MLLSEFLAHGSRTRSELAEARSVTEFEISQTAETTGMDSARRRGLIIRRIDTCDAAERPLPQPEWDITAEGRRVHQKERWQAAARVALRAMRVVVPLAAAGFALAKFILGDDVIPDSGLIDEVNISGIWQSDMGPTLMGMVAGMLPQLAVYPLLAASRRRHMIRGAVRFLDQASSSDR